MRHRTLTALAAVGLAIAIPVSVATAWNPRGEFNSGGILQLGTGSKTCTLKRGASCKSVKHHHADMHGMDLRGAHFEKAELHHSDFRQADLRGAHFEGAKLRGVDFSGAKLKGAYFGPPRKTGKGAHQAQPAPWCNPNCYGADLRGANFTRANLTSADLTRANLAGANLARAKGFKK
jgi:uncharacterized protein YjbI with pentapeptide repeats